MKVGDDVLFYTNELFAESDELFSETAYLGTIEAIREGHYDIKWFPTAWWMGGLGERAINVPAIHVREPREWNWVSATANYMDIHKYLNYGLYGCIIILVAVKW